MTAAQTACLLMASPFLALSLIWLVGLTVVALMGDE